MVRPWKSWKRMSGAMLALMLLASCSLPLPAPSAPAASATPVPTIALPTALPTPEPTATEAPPPPTTTTAAAGVRAALDRLFGEHVMLVAFTTDAALGGRADESAAFAAALDGNSVDLAAVIGSVYGDAAGAAFLDLWREHIVLVVEYTQALAAGDAALAEQKVQELLNYTFELGDFLEAANPNLRSADVAALVKPHILTLKAVIDAQQAQDFAAAYANVREAYAHMDHVSTAIAGAIAQQFPETIPGDADSPAADLRAHMNQIFQEHVGLAISATGAALGGRTAQFEAAAAKLDANSQDLGAAFASLYGDAVGADLLEQWRSHIDIVVAYTVAVGAGNTANADLQIQAFGEYAMTFGNFIHSLQPALGAQGVMDLFKMHWFGLQNVIDQQAAQDWPAAAELLRHGLGHMGLIADPFAQAFVQQAPDSFR